MLCRQNYCGTSLRSDAWANVRAIIGWRTNFASSVTQVPKDFLSGHRNSSKSVTKYDDAIDLYLLGFWALIVRYSNYDRIFNSLGYVHWERFVNVTWQWHLSHAYAILLSRLYRIPKLDINSKRMSIWLTWNLNSSGNSDYAFQLVPDIPSSSWWPNNSKSDGRRA